MYSEIVLLWHRFFIVSFSHSLVLQRSGTRRRYQDDGISDDEIDGKRTFDLEEKLHNNRFNSDRVKRMEGKGEKEMQLFMELFKDLNDVCNLTLPVVVF